MALHSVIQWGQGSRGYEVMGLDEATNKVSANVFKKFEDHLVGTVNKWVMRVCR